MSKKKQRETVDEEIMTPVEPEEAVDAASEAAQATEGNDALAAANAKAEEYLNLAQRVQADFDNYRRRNNTARSEAFEDGAVAFIKTLLPVIDNMERALAPAAESPDPALSQGVKMISEQLIDILDKRGVKVINRIGERFDPNLENAVLQGTEEDGEPGTVCEVFQKGYKINDTVLRYAMVKVVAE